MWIENRRKLNRWVVMNLRFEPQMDSITKFYMLNPVQGLGSELHIKLALEQNMLALEQNKHVE